MPKNKIIDAVSCAEIRRYDVDKDDKTVTITIPASWLRKHLSKGGTIGLYQRSDNAAEPGFEVSIIGGE